MQSEMIEFLQKFSQMKPSERYENIEKLTDKEVDYLAEVCKNFLHKKIKVNQKQIKELKSSRLELKLLASKNRKNKIKKKILKSIKGGFILHLLLPLALKTLLSL